MERKEIKLQRRENELRSKELDRQESVMNVTLGNNHAGSQYSSRNILNRCTDANAIARGTDEGGYNQENERMEPRTRHTKPSPLGMPELKLREITETIPQFDGYNLSVLQFARACKRAMDLFPDHPSAEIEGLLVRRIPAKLNGHAYSVTEDQELYTIEQLVSSLKAAFQPTKSASHYKDQLANIYMKAYERVLDYTERIKELKLVIIEVEMKESANYYTSREDALRARYLMP